LISREQLLGGASDGRRSNAFRKIYSRMFAETFESPNVHALAFGVLGSRLRRVFFRAERQLQRGFIGAFAQTATAFSGR